MPRNFLLAAAFVLLAPAPSTATSPSTAPLELVDPSLVQSLLPDVAQRCCKTCKKGKACGNTCIARDKDCHKPPGCACDG